MKQQVASPHKLWATCNAFAQVFHLCRGCGLWPLVTRLLLLCEHCVCVRAGLRLPPSMPVLYEQQGGILEPEKMISAHVKVAQYHGAQVHTGGQGLQSAGGCHQRAYCNMLTTVRGGRVLVQCNQPAAHCCIGTSLSRHGFVSSLFSCINRAGACAVHPFGPRVSTVPSTSCVCWHTWRVCVCVCTAGEAFQGWTVLPDGLVEVVTDRGTYRAERLVLAAGAWMDQLVPELQVSCAHKCVGRDTRFCAGVGGAGLSALVAAGSMCRCAFKRGMPT